jgi:hypothetical protein
VVRANYVRGVGDTVRDRRDGRTGTVIQPDAGYAQAAVVFVRWADDTITTEVPHNLDDPINDKA